MDPTSSIAAAQNLSPLQNTSATASPTPGPGSASEVKLLDYIARLQSDAAYGQQFANPTGLGSEAFKVLKGYLERVRDMQDNVRDKGSVMSKTELADEAQDAPKNESMVAPGPAQQKLENILPVDAHPAGTAASISGGELDRAVQLLSKMLNFSLESTFVGTATGNVSKSTNTLLRGQ